MAFTFAASSSSAAVLLTAFVLLLGVLLDAPSSAVGARLSAVSLRGDTADVAGRELEAVPDWPCCRQYDLPPAETLPEEEASDSAVVKPLEERELPIPGRGPFYYPPSPSPAAVAPVPAHHERPAPSPRHIGLPDPGPDGEEELETSAADTSAAATWVEASAETATGGAEETTAEPEWPCCRQYDTPPAGTS